LTYVSQTQQYHALQQKDVTNNNRLNDLLERI